MENIIRVEKLNEIIEKVNELKEKLRPVLSEELYEQVVSDLSDISDVEEYSKILDAFLKFIEYCKEYSDSIKNLIQEICDMLRQVSDEDIEDLRSKYLRLTECFLTNKMYTDTTLHSRNIFYLVKSFSEYLVDIELETEIDSIIDDELNATKFVKYLDNDINALNRLIDLTHEHIPTSLQDEKDKVSAIVKYLDITK